MATSVEAKAYEALKAHLESFGAGLEIAWPGVNYPQPTAAKPAKYLRVTFAPNTPTNPFIEGDGTIRMGLFLILICWPVGEGIVKPTDLAGALRDWFAFDGGNRRVLVGDGVAVRIGVEQAPSVGGAEQDKVQTEIPVVVPWHVYP